MLNFRAGLKQSWHLMRDDDEINGHDYAHDHPRLAGSNGQGSNPIFLRSRTTDGMSLNLPASLRARSSTLMELQPCSVRQERRTPGCTMSWDDVPVTRLEMPCAATSAQQACPQPMPFMVGWARMSSVYDRNVALKTTTGARDRWVNFEKRHPNGNRSDIGNHKEERTYILSNVSP
jgi:hypothetical protein